MVGGLSSGLGWGPGRGDPWPWQTWPEQRLKLATTGRIRGRQVHSVALATAAREKGSLNFLYLAHLSLCIRLPSNVPILLKDFGVSYPSEI